MPRNKRSKPRGTQPVPNTSNEDSLATSMARLGISRQAPSNTSDDSHSIPAGAVRLSRRNIVTAFNTYIGDESKLENWRRLCQDVGIEGDFPSITKCRNALRTVWVNIYDLLEARNIGEHPRHFPNRKALVKYTIENDKIYPKTAAKADGAVKALLRHIF